MSKTESGITQRVRLCGDGHAIDRFCLGIEWDDPLDQQSMMELSALAQEITELPRRIEIRSSEKKLGEAGPESVPFEEQAELLKIVLDNNQGTDEKSEDNKTVEVVIKQQGLFFQVLASTYISWTDTKEKGLSLTEVFVNKILELRRLSSVGLQVIDAFSFDRELSFSKLFNEQGEYLPKTMFKKDAYWRFDQSCYEIEATSLSMLTNYQVVHSPGEEGEDDVTIGCLHRFDFAEEQNLTIKDLYSHYDSLYDKNKTLIASILSDDLSDLIGIKAKSNRNGKS